MHETNSGLGKASFIISIVAGVFILFLFILVGILEETNPGMIDEKSDSAGVLGCSIMLLWLAELVALGLGIGGMCVKGRKKVLAILGTCFSVAALFGSMCVVILGMATG
jgi:hypothetical protein